jgi:oligopeptide transport system substrate-binding protein
LKLNPVPTFAEFRDRRTGTPEFVIYFGSWGADYPDPANFYQPLAGCGVSGIQVINYCNKEFDAAWKAGASEQDTAKRDADYQLAEKLLQDDAALIPTYSGVWSILVKPTIANWTYTPLQQTRFRDAQITKK